MATMVELAQRILTKRPTVALTWETAIWLAASSPTRARDPRTEITRPKDVTAVEPGMSWVGIKPPLCRRGLEKRLNRSGSGLVKSAVSWSGFDLSDSPDHLHRPAFSSKIGTFAL